MPPEKDWTTGPAKWVAVGVLGAASVAGMTWTIAQKYPAPVRGGVVQIPARQEVASPPVVPGRALPGGEQEFRQAGGGEVKAIPDPAAVEEGTPAPLIERIAENPGIIGVEEPVVVPPPVIDRAPTLTRIINVNTAPAAELELLPGIGPALAGRIIEYRQSNGAFRNVEELTNVRGIGPKTLEKLRPRVRVE